MITIENDKEREEFLYDWFSKLDKQSKGEYSDSSNKDLEYYMSKHYKMVVVEDDEGLYTLYFPDLPGCITSAHTPVELFEMAEDAKRAWISAAIEDGVKISEPSEVHY